jgi:hypothetical protein
MCKIHHFTTFILFSTILFFIKTSIWMARRGAHAHKFALILGAKKI